jgi:hypothetical protein
MKKTPTIFNRNPKNPKELLKDHHIDCSWVFNGEGVATKKYDGTCCLVKNSKLWKRREIKKDKPTPVNFIKADFDNKTGKTVGWVPVTDVKENAWHLEAFKLKNLADGTYELCGPKIQGNPEGYKTHVLIPHSEATQYPEILRTFEGIKLFLDVMDIEGIVFHHKDGRQAKIKKRDYQLKRKPSY